MDSRINARRHLHKAVMLGSFAFGFMAFILPVYTKEIGGNAVSIGGLFSIFSIVTLILRPLIGKGIDKYGRKIFLIIAFITYGLSMILFSLSTDISLLYISRFVQAIASSFMWISVYSVAIDLANRKERGSQIGYIGQASSQGELYGAFLGFFIIGNLNFLTGWSVLFKIYAVLAFIGAYIIYKQIPETKVLVEEQTITKKKLSKKYKQLLVIVFISAVSVSMLSPIYIVYLIDRFTNDLALLALCFIPSALVYSYLQNRLGAVSDKIGRTKPIALGLVLSGVLSISLTMVSNLYLVAILWTIVAIGISMSSPAETALVADMTGDNIRGSAYGYYTMVGSLGASIGPIIGGLLYEYLGQTIPFYVNGALLIINAIIVIIVLRNYKSDQSSVTTQKAI